MSYLSSYGGGNSISIIDTHRVKQAIFKFQVKGCFRLGRAAVSGSGISHAKACSNARTQMGYREMPILVLAAQGSVMAGGGRSGTDACNQSSGAR